MTIQERARLPGYEGPISIVRQATLSNFYAELCEYHVEEFESFCLDWRILGSFVRGVTLTNPDLLYEGALEGPRTSDGYQWLALARVRLYGAVEVAILFPHYEVTAWEDTAVVELQRDVTLYCKVFDSRKRGYQHEYAEELAQEILLSARSFLEV